MRALRGSILRKSLARVWRGEGDFLSLLAADKDVRKHLSADELEENFDLGYHFKHVDAIFERVFGKTTAASDRRRAPA